MQITRSSIDTAKGPSDWFTGDVYIDSVAAAPPPSRLTANLVHFMPGARTHWHRHPLSHMAGPLGRGVRRHACGRHGGGAASTRCVRAGCTRSGSARC